MVLLFILTVLALSGLGLVALNLGIGRWCRLEEAEGQKRVEAQRRREELAPYMHEAEREVDELLGIKAVDEFVSKTCGCDVCTNYHGSSSLDKRLAGLDDLVCPTCGRDRAWHFVNNMYCIVELRPGVKTMFGDWQHGKLQTQLSYDQCLKCGHKALPGAYPKHDCVPKGAEKLEPGVYVMRGITSAFSNRQPSFSDLISEAKDAINNHPPYEEEVLVQEGPRSYFVKRKDQ